MLKREIKVNLKSLIIWASIIMAMFLLVYLVYPTIASNENIKMLNEMLEVFPKELLKAFNMDISAIDTVFGWLKSEGFVFILLAISCYSAILGSTILLKEENDKTIEYLISLPIKRNDIIKNKVITGLINITLMTLVIGFFNYIGLSLSGDFNKLQYILLSLSPLFCSYVVFFGCLFLSTFFHKTKNTLVFAFGIVFVGYVFQILSTMSDKISFIKYFSPFSLADTRNIIISESINLITIVISLTLSFIFLVLTIIKYNKKELV